jgi:hypothetical protein
VWQRSDRRTAAPRPCQRSRRGCGRVGRSPALPERVEAGIDGEAVDPGGHRRRIVEVLDASVHLDEDLLGLVLGIFPAAHETVRGCVYPRFQLPDERLKGARVVGKGLLAQAGEGLRRQ